jgi:hypothetical protein
MACVPALPDAGPTACTFTIPSASLGVGPITIIVAATDVPGNSGSATVTGDITGGGFLMSIDDPVVGPVLTVNGVTYGSVIATIPADVSWSGGTPPYDTSGLAVEAGGLVTTDLTITSPTTATGDIEVACDETAGSFGTTANVTVSTYGVLDSLATPATPDSITVDLQLGEIGVEDVTVYDFVSTFSVPLNAYYDASLLTPNNAFAFYDIRIDFDPTVINADCAGTPASGSSGVFATPGPEFDGVPTVFACDNIAGFVQINAVQGANPSSPNGFFNLASFNFIRVGAAGTSTPLTATLIDYCNYDGDCFGLGDIPAGYPWPVWPTYVKSGVVDIIAAPAPDIAATDDDFAAPYDNTMPQGMPTNLQIFGSNFVPGFPVVGCVDTGAGCACIDGLPDGETEVCVEGVGIPVFLFVSGNVVSGGEIDTVWNIFGAGGPYHVTVENPDGQPDAWGPSQGDPGLTITP